MTGDSGWSPPVTRYHCLIGSCPWTAEYPGPDFATGEASGPVPPGDLPALIAGRVEDVLRAHLATHPLEHWVAEVGRLREQAPAPAPDLTGVQWRLGGSHKRNLYAEAGFSDGKPGTYAGHMDTDELATRACADHNAMLDLSWLVAAGLDVRVEPCGGAGRCCGDTAGRFSVLAVKPDPVAAALPLPGGVESHGHASPGEALAFARDWWEREGITP